LLLGEGEEGLTGPEDLSGEQVPGDEAELALAVDGEAQVQAVLSRLAGGIEGQE
jgi:hypothetical protein